MSIVTCVDLVEVGALGPLSVANLLETTAPVLLSAEIGAVDDSTSVLTFDEGVVSSDFAVGWSATVDTVPPTSLTITGATQVSPTVVHLEVTEDVYTGQTVLLSYSAVAGDITDVSGLPTPNALASITDRAVTNNSLTPQPVVPWSRAYSRGWLNQTATTVSRATLSGWVQQA